MSCSPSHPGKIVPMDLSEFGGEGRCFATLTGPGRVWIQSLPFTRLAARLGAGKHDSGVKIRIGA